MNDNHKRRARERQQKYLANPENKRRQKLRRNSPENLAKRRSYYQRRKEEISKQHKERQRALNQEVYAAYGGKCACCGEAEPCFLTIDHKHGRQGEARHIKSQKSGFGFYGWLKKHGFPQDNYQLLCINCNMGRYRNGGICPHQQ